MARLLSLVVLLAIIVVIGVVFFRVMASFIVPLFLAALLVVIFNPVYGWLTERLGGHSRLAAAVTTVLIALSVLVPVSWVVTLATMEGVAVAANLDDVTFKERFFRLRRNLGLEMAFAEDLNRMQSALERLVAPPAGEAAPDPKVTATNVLDRLHSIEALLGERTGPQLQQEIDILRATLRQLQEGTPGTIIYDDQIALALDHFEDFRTMLLGGHVRAYAKDLVNLSDEEFRELSERSFAMLTGWLLPVAGATTAIILKVVIGIVILLVAVYYFLADGPGMIRTTMRLVPLDDRYEKELLVEFAQISRAVVLATLLSAVVQGLLAGIGYAVAGLESVFLLMLLTAVLALIPFLGAAAVWLPASLWLYVSEERMLAAILLAAYGAGVVSTVDNIIKPFVLQGQSHLHPLLALLSVLGGVQALGPIGLLIGPMSVAFLQTLLNILHREITSMERSRGDTQTV